MKKISFRRCAAAIAACAVMASAMPVVPAYTSAAENLITNSTFENGAFDWGIYKESGGAGTITTEDGKLALNVTNQGKLNYAVQLFYDILPLYKNGVYRLKFDISASLDRYVEAMIQQNGGTYQSYVWKGLEVTKEPKSYDIEFTMEYPTDIMSKLCFNCGIQEVDGELPPHTIYLDNVSLELVDDSNVDYAADLPYEADIIASQVGYRPSAKKTAVFRTDKGGEFSVVDAATGKSVYTGKMENPYDYSLAGESGFTGDFSSVTAPGKYYITSYGLDDSYAFEIGDNVYSKLLDDSVRMLYLQRCGCEIVDDKFSHPACHDTQATIYKTTQKIDVSGGWHDAGDYGRYVVAAAKAVADLLYAYQTAPDMYSDSIGIPESGNGIPDILDEVRYELEWMLKMQDQTDGGVYHKVTCENFPGYVMPEDETKPLIVMPKSTTATADFAASMAMAYEFYKDIDTAFADKCLDAAEKAYAWAKANPNVLYANPADVVTGEYGDKFTSDELYWAAAQLCRATGDESYMDGVSLKTGLDWSTVGDYGNIAILTTERIDKSSELYKNAAAAVKKQADDMLAITKSSPYGVALDEFNWGSNMTIANAGIIMALTYQLTGDETYLVGANKQLDYLLGMNPNGYSFVTGYGTVTPENPHHRPSMAVGEAMIGMLVGGVNQNLEDSAAKAYCKRNPAAKCWVDNAESYSTNEITIYWNSPLTYLLSMTEIEAGTPSIPSDGEKWGDANCDGNVTVADAAAVLQFLGNNEKYPLTEEGKRLADVYEQGDGLTTRDALSIQKFVLGRIPSLPESVMQGAETTAPPAATTTKNTQHQTTTATTSATTTATTTAKPSNGIKDLGTPMNEKATAVEDFRDGSSKLFFASDGWENGDPFDCFWYEQNTSLKNGMLSLTIDKDHSGKYNYSGAEYRTFDSYGYGYYETSMQAIKNNGVVSSFFTYTGPSEDNPWDEIDIEILGKDTTKVQLNYYTNGVGNHEYMYDLGFDSSEGFHTYGFDWQPDHITWYVDGKPVHTAYDNIPVTPGRIMMNTWPGRGVDEWLNHYDGKTPLTAHYQWVTYNKQ